jgi:Tol biopolymer transport system component
MKPKASLGATICLLLLSLFVSGCAAPAAAPATGAPTAMALAASPTSRPATDTPIPPTDTPVPPTDTPLPPTDTPTQTATEMPTETPTSVPSPTARPIPATETPVPRPILYFSLAEVEGKSKGVAKAVFGDGRSLGIVDDSVGAVWSPNGEWFADVSFDRKQLNLGSLKGELTAILAAEGEEEFIPAVAWSVDSQKIAVITGMPGQYDPGLELLVVDVTKKQALSHYALAGSLQSDYLVAPTKFRWSPDGQKILIVWQSTIVVDLKSGMSETISDRSLAAEWTSDGQAIYYLGFSDASPPELESLNLKALGSDQPRKLADKSGLTKLDVKSSGYTLSLGLLALSPDGKRLVLVGGADEGGVMYVYNLAETGTIALGNPAGELRTTEPIVALDWSPQGSGLAFMTVSKGPNDGDYNEYSLALQYWDLTSAQAKSLDSIPIGRYAFYLSDQFALMRLLNFKLLSWSR